MASQNNAMLGKAGEDSTASKCGARPVLVRDGPAWRDIAGEERNGVERLELHGAVRLERAA